MKRIVSIALALLLVLSCAPAALAARAPYSQAYLFNLSEIEFLSYETLADLETAEYTGVDHTLEYYDCTELLDDYGKWDEMLKTIRAVFRDYGWTETAQKDESWYFEKDKEVLIIWNKDDAFTATHRNGFVVIEHYRMVPKPKGEETHPDAPAWPYAKGIQRVKFGRCELLPDETGNGELKFQRTLEVYDAGDLWMFEQMSWAKVIGPFGAAFRAAGFTETKEPGGGMRYRKNTEEFYIWDETSSTFKAGTHGVVYIEHAWIEAVTPDETETDPYYADPKAAADYLHSLGMFNGTGQLADGSPDYELGIAPTRAQAVTMLVRLLGKENEANSGNWRMPFTDVPPWAQGCVGYAYAKGLTNGTSATTFGSNDPVTASQYLTFVLRALGYSSESDFKWDSAWTLTDRLGMTRGEYNARTLSFLRADVALISANGLAAPMKGGQTTLLEYLENAKKQ